jgi:hypothetical protein
VKDPQLPPEALRELEAEWDRQTQAFCRFIRRWPNFRVHAAYALLGGAVGTADMMGCDVDGWLCRLRQQEPKPAPICPPKGS